MSRRQLCARARPDIRAGAAACGRSDHPPPDQGFTLVEMLVVIIVIGILAAIALPIYTGLQNNAANAGTVSDLRQAKGAIVGYAIEHSSSFPAAVADDSVGTVSGGTLAGYGWVRSPKTTSLIYQVTGTGAAQRWCIDGVVVTGVKYRISSNTAVALGDCATLGAAAF